MQYPLHALFSDRCAHASTTPPYALWFPDIALRVRSPLPLPGCVGKLHQASSIVVARFVVTTPHFVALGIIINETKRRSILINTSGCIRE